MKNTLFQAMQYDYNKLHVFSLKKKIKMEFIP